MGRPRRFSLNLPLMGRLWRVRSICKQVASKLNAEVERREEERREVDCKFVASFDTIIKKVCEKDRCASH